MLQYRTYKRRRFIRSRGRFPVYRRNLGFLARPLGNPLAVTERKYHDLELITTLVNYPVAGSWTNNGLDPYGPAPGGGPPILAESFNAITVGTSWQQRIGRKIQIISIKFKGEIGLQTSADNPPALYPAQTIRYLLYIDQQTNGIFSSNPGDLLYSGPSASIPIHYFQNGSSFGRYKILCDEKFVLNPISVYYNPSGATFSMLNSNVRIIDFTYNFNPPLTVHYNSQNTGTNLDIIDNSIHFCAGRDNSGLPPVFCNYKARITFYDA